MYLYTALTLCFYNLDIIIIVVVVVVVVVILLFRYYDGKCFGD